MKRHSFARSILSFLLLVLFVIPSSAFAAKPTATPPLYPEATLAPDAPAYDANFPENLEPEQLYAWSAILIESVSGDVIFEKSPDELRFPASTTKIMTCYLGITMVEDLDMVVTVSPTAASTSEGCPVISASLVSVTVPASDMLVCPPDVTMQRY